MRMVLPPPFRTAALASVVVVATLGLFSKGSSGSFSSTAFAASTSLFSGSLIADAGCEEIAEWVEANRGRLPTSLGALSMYPVSYRRAIVGALTNDQKVAVWHAHLQTFLSTQGALGPEQRDFIESVQGRLQAFFADAGTDEELRALQIESMEVLGADLAARVFANVGPAETPLFGLARLAGIQCACSTSSDWCSGGYDCYSGPCDATSRGCGTLWLYSCNGLCWDGKT